MTVVLSQAEAKGESPYPIAHIHSVDNASRLKSVKGPVNTDPIQLNWCRCCQNLLVGHGPFGLLQYLQNPQTAGSASESRSS